MQFRLRTLLIVLAVGPVVLWGLYAFFQLPAPLFRSVIFLLSLPVGVAVGAFAFWLHWMAETELSRRLGARQNLSDAELTVAFGSQTGVNAIEHLRLISQSLGVDYAKLRPDDSLADLVRPSWLAEHFRCESLEVLLSQRYCWNSEEPVPNTLGELLARLCERSV